MIIITRRDDHKIILYETENVNLNNLNFSNMNFEGGLFTYQSARKCDFTNANLRWTHWRNADLSYSILDKADVTDSNFLWAKLTNIHGYQSIMREIFAVAADFTNSILINSYFNNSDMRSAKFIGCDLTESILTNSNLTSYFTNSCLYNVNLSHSWFYDYEYRKEKKASMKFSNITNVNFFKSDLRGLDLTSTISDNINVENAFYDINTKWPESFNPKKLGAILLSAGTNISNKDLKDAHLVYLKLNNVKAIKTNFNKSYLKYSEFSNSDFEGANLDYCNLSDTTFENTNLINTSLFNAKIARCNFINADLRGADMRFDIKHFHSCTDEKREFTLKNAKYDKTTIWPDEFDPREWDR